MNSRSRADDPFVVLIHSAAVISGHATVNRSHHGNQNVHPACSWYVRGATKCVPLNVERKLYKATLSVRLITLKRKRSLFFSVRSRLSTPTPRSNRWRGATRAGLLSGSSVPAAGTTIRLAVMLSGAQVVKPAFAVA